MGRLSAKDGGVYKKLGVHKPCPVCSSPVYYTQGDLSKNKRKCCSRSCRGNDPVFLDKMKSVDKSYMQTEDYKATKRKESTPAYKRYKNEVHRLSQKIYEQHIDDINPERHLRTVCGVDGGYQLDHIKPIIECFTEGWSVEEASAIHNLRILPWKENLMRQYERE